MKVLHYVDNRLFHTRYSNNLISWYDEQFNKRARGDGDRLPDLRSWDGHKLAWAPERSDFPMKGKILMFIAMVAQLVKAPTANLARLSSSPE